jgi:hypothetical protein
MSDDTTVKKVFLGKPEGKREAERSKLRWLHCTENGLKSMGVKRRRKKSGDRSAWVIILKEVLVKLIGPHANEEDEEEHPWSILPTTLSPVFLAKLSSCCDRQQSSSSLQSSS